MLTIPLDQLERLQEEGDPSMKAAIGAERRKAAFNFNRYIKQVFSLAGHIKHLCRLTSSRRISETFDKLFTVMLVQPSGPKEPSASLSILKSCNSFAAPQQAGHQKRFSTSSYSWSKIKNLNHHNP
jgi:hypothetical protein